MPFLISKAAAAITTAAVISSTPQPEQNVFEHKCYYVPVRHVYIFDIYETVQVECYSVPARVR